MNPELSNHDLLIKFLAGEASADEVMQVEGWLKESPVHQGELDTLKQMFEATDFQSKPAGVDTDKAWNKLKAKMDAAGKGAKVIRLDQRKVVSDSGNFRRYFGIAATITGILIAAAVIFRLTQSPETIQFADIVATSQTITDTLSDGSIVTLNKNSTLHYPVAFADGWRRVKLRGEAFFDIAKDSLNPFIIEVGGAEVKVLGTSFNVKAYDNGETVEVIVETGVVELKSISKKETIVLEQGSKGIFIKSTTMLSKSLNEEVNYDFWRSHKLTFRNTPVKDVVEALNNYYAAGITFENEDIGKCRFTATFEDDSLNTILEILTMTFQLGIKESASGKVLSGNGCEDAQL